MTIVIKNEKDAKKVKNFLDTVLAAEEAYEGLNVELDETESIDYEAIRAIKAAKRTVKKIRKRAEYPAYLTMFN